MRTSRMRNFSWKFLLDRIRSLWNLDKQRALSVSVMGQTGVGKTSLVNALFGSAFKVSSTRPETLEPQKWLEKMRDGHKLEFWDLPGFGESHLSDGRYFEEYKTKMFESDIVIWAIHADSRSFKFDRRALEDLISSVPANERSRIMNKIIFILTKVDLLAPAPWTLAKVNSHGIFTVHGETEQLLIAKESYFQEAFVAPFAHLLKAQTHRSRNFSLRDENLDYDEHTVYYKGWMSRDKLANLLELYPEHKNVFHSLYNNYRVIPCSSRFRFNLDPLMEAIVNKLEAHSIASLENVLEPGRPLNVCSFDTAKSFRNMVILDQAKNQLHDLDAIDYN